MDKIIQFIESERVKQKLTKKELCRAVDITPQYYDLLINGKSTENRKVTELLLFKLGYKLAPIPKDL
jgi:transcriptional regulator with XRE-family HTH domain